MQYEVEMKFPVKDREALERIVFQNPGLTVEELDLYFQHPCRDFAKTDEGFRVRCQDYEGGESQCFLTYKGPKIDPETKTRKEIDIPFSVTISKNCARCAALSVFTKRAGSVKSALRLLFHSRAGNFTCALIFYPIWRHGICRVRFSKSKHFVTPSISQTPGTTSSASRTASTRKVSSVKVCEKGTLK